MRTKSFLAAAALIAAGALTSQAQSNVYSLNVVGYVNLTLKPGYNLVTPQLKDASGSTDINVLLTNAPTLTDNSTFIGWDAAIQGFTDSAVWVSADSGGPAWYLPDFSAPSTATAPRGKSYFVYNAGLTDSTLTLVGEVAQGSAAVAVPNNYSFLGDVVPASGELKTNGFPIVDNATLLTWDAAAQAYAGGYVGVGPDSGGPAWYQPDFSAEVIFAPAVGQGFVHFAPSGASTWTRNFTVQ